MKFFSLSQLFLATVLLHTLLEQDSLAQEIRTLTGHQSGIYSIAYTSDEKTLVSGSLDHTVKVWDHDSGKVLRSCDEAQGGIFAIAISKDDQFFASGGMDRVIRIYSFKAAENADEKEKEDEKKKGQPTVVELKGHQGPIYSLVFHPNGKLLLSASGDKTIRLWDLERKKELAVFTGHTHQVLSLAIHPQGHSFVSGGRDGKMILWDLAGKTARTFDQGENSGIESVDFTRDGYFVVSGGLDQTTQLWNLTNDSAKHVTKNHNAPIASVAFSPNENRIVSVDYSGSVVVAAPYGDQHFQTTLPSLSGRTICCAPNGKELAVGTSDSNLYLISLPQKAR